MRDLIAKVRAAMARRRAGFVTRSQPSSGPSTLRHSRRVERAPERLDWQVLPAWLEWVVRDGDNPLDGQPPERDR